MLLPLMIIASSCAQIPPSQRLPAEDEKAFRAEVRRIQGLLETAADKCTVEYALARTWASGGQFREAIDTLRRSVERNVGLDPSDDGLFTKLSGSKEFRALLERVRQSTPAIRNSSVAFKIAEPDLIPEGIAYDPLTSSFYIGSIHKHKIVRCTARGVCETFAGEGLGEVLGMKVDPRGGSLWATSNSETESALVCIDLQSGKQIGRYVLSSTTGRHQLNTWWLPPSETCSLPIAQRSPSTV